MLIVSNVFPPQIFGGAEIVAYRQAIELTKHGFEVFILAGEIEDSPNQIRGKFIENIDGLRIFRMTIPPLGFDENYRRGELEFYIRSVLRVVRPTTVHLHNLPGIGAGAIVLAKDAGANVFVTLHDTWGFCLRQTALRSDEKLCENFTECDLCLSSVASESGERLPVRMRRDYVRWCLERADWLFSPSVALQKSYVTAGFDRSRFLNLSNGINLSGFPPRQRNPVDNVSFLCASTLRTHKGIETLFDALEILLTDPMLTGRWRLVLGGEGPLESELKSRFAAGKLTHPVEWMGFIARNEMGNVLNQADVVVLASIWPENQPVILLEAIASGAAQIGTNVGGIPELIEDEKSGLLVPPGNASALASAMRRLILDTTLVHRFSARTIERRADYDEQNSIQKLVQLFTTHTPRIHDEDTPVVLCWGTMEDIGPNSLLSCRLRKLNDQILLLWNEWIPQETKIEPALICIFGDNIPLAALGRVIVNHIPILASKNISTEAALACGEFLYQYDSVGDALDIMEMLIQGKLTD